MFSDISNFFKFVLSETALTYRDHLSLRGHERRPVAEPQLGLQGVEVDLQLAFLLHAGRLVDATVVTEILQLLLHGAHGLLRHAVLQPGDGATDPLEKLQKRNAKVTQSTLITSVCSLHAHPHTSYDLYDLYSVCL